jgi:predicted dehydrogenase
MTRVGIIGCGVIAKAYAEKLSALPLVDLVACADLDRPRAQTFAATHHIERVHDVAGLLADADVDTIVNLTVPQAHYEVSEAAIAAGKSVYSEKPLALTAAQGRALLTAADDRGVRIGCAPDTFLGAGLQTCRALLDAGAIGEPVGASAFMLSSGPERWHPGPAVFYQRGAGPLFDMGPYYFTALVALLGPLKRIAGAVRRTHAERPVLSEPLRGQRIGVEVPTHVACVADFVGGPIATLVTSFDVQASRFRCIEIYGTEGTLAVPDPNTFGGSVQIKRHAGDEWQTQPLTHANAQQSRGIGLGEMVAAMEAGRPHRASGALALHVLEAMQATIDSSTRGAHVMLASRCERPAALPAGLADDEFH